MEYVGSLMSPSCGEHCQQQIDWTDFLVCQHFATGDLHSYSCTSLLELQNWCSCSESIKNIKPKWWRIWITRSIYSEGANPFLSRTVLRLGQYAMFVLPCFPQQLSVETVLKYQISMIELWITHPLSWDTMINQVPLLSHHFYCKK